MKDFRYMAIVAAAALGLAVAGCGSSGSDDTPPVAAVSPEKMCVDAGGSYADGECTSAEDLLAQKQQAQRGDIETAIGMAETAVVGLTDDASDAAIEAADTAVAAAKKAVTGASDLPDPEKDAHNNRIAGIERQLGTKKTSIMAARDKADDAMKAEMAATGKALHAALAGPDAGGNALVNIAAPTFSATGDLEVPVSADGAGALDTGDTNPAATLIKVDASAGSLGSWNGTDYASSGGTNEARVYTSQGPGKSVAFTADSSGLTASGDAFTVETGNASNVGGSAFVHQATQTHEFNAPGEVAFETRGTYLDAPGTYRCTANCTSTNDGSGPPSALGGTWTFTPDKGAMVSRPDAEYLYYGWWVSKDSDGAPTVASAFAGAIGVTTDGALRTAGDLTAIAGSATYVGNAAGKFAMSNPLDSTGNGGHFTADAELNAKFSGTGAGITGTIHNFRLNDGTDDPDWSVALNYGMPSNSDGAITFANDDTTANVDESVDTTVWSIKGNVASPSGSWTATMYDDAVLGDENDGNTIPTAVTGTFYSEFSSIGRMVGAFGAEKTE